MSSHGRLVKKEDCLLLVVDIQKTLFDLCVDSAQVHKNVVALLQAAQCMHVPIVFSQQNADKIGPFLPDLTAAAPEAQLYDKLEFSCFSNPALNQAIAASGRRTLILTGIESHVCIFQTGTVAIDEGYTVHVVADAVSARSADNRRTGLQRLERAGAVMTSTEMVIFEWLERAGTQTFRELLPLLKTF